jgi:hypothetical protein
MTARHSKARGERAAGLLRIAGAVLLAAGLAHLYLDRVVFEARPFSTHAALALADPRVSGYVAERIADEVVAQRRDLVAYRPLLIGTARAVVSSDAFRAGFARAAESGHALLFSRAATQLALSVPDIGVLVKSALAQDPGVAARLPPRLRAAVTLQPSGRVARALLRLAQLGHRFRRNAIAAILIGVALLAAGILLPRDRRKALLGGGAAVATAALVLFFLPPLGRTALTLAVESPELRGLSAGLWDAFLSGLRGWALVLTGIGVVLASAASAAADRVEVEELVRRAWRRLQEPARTTAGEVARALALTGAGLLLALRPAGTLRAIAVLLGALVAFEGLRELFRALPPRVLAGAPEGAPEPAAPPSVARTAAHHAVVGALVLALVAGAIQFLRSSRALPAVAPVTDACNGDRSLCGRRLDEVVFPAAHNSMSAAELPGWLFPNQELGSVSLLGRGVRALLFDVHNGVPIGDRVRTELDDELASRAKFEKALGKEGVDAAMRIRARLQGAPTGPRAAYLCHGFCELGSTLLVEMLEGVRDFLVAHPGEVLVFVIEDYVPAGDIEAAFRESGLERYVYRGPVAPPFPTLREMIDSDQRVVVFGENVAAGAVPWYHPAFETIQETPYRFLAPSEFSCRPNRGGAAAPLFQINHWIETTPTPKPSNAAIVNARAFLLERTRACQKERGKLPNLLAVDFAATGDVVAVAGELNGLAPQVVTAPASAPEAKP